MNSFSICFTYFRSLALANLGAALYSIRRQDLSRVESLVVVDNNTDDSDQSIRQVINDLDFPMPVRLSSWKHGNAKKTHSWSTNKAVRESSTPWVLFTRADYVLDFDLVAKFVGVVDGYDHGWNGFVTAHVYHLNVDIAGCEATAWRRQGPGVFARLPGVENRYTTIDAGVWMARRRAFDQVGGLDESLSAWGHAQTHFQHKLYEQGVEFVVLPEPLFYHPLHAGERDIEAAHRQLAERGVRIQDLWARYEGAQPY